MRWLTRVPSTPPAREVLAVNRMELAGHWLLKPENDFGVGRAGAAQVQAAGARERGLTAQLQELQWECDTNDACPFLGRSLFSANAKPRRPLSRLEEGPFRQERSRRGGWEKVLCLAGVSFYDRRSHFTCVDEFS